MGRSRDDQTRMRLADEAARIVLEQGIQDFQLAKRKAADSLGLGPRCPMPRNTQIEEAIRSRQSLFGGEQHNQHLQSLRRTALEGLKFFARFQPRLVGPVLNGTADQHSAVGLHLFADSPEEVTLFLDSNGVPYEQQTRRVRVLADSYENFPVVVFTAGEGPIDATIFPAKRLRQAPLSPVDGKPMARAGVREVEQLLLADAGASW